MSDLILADLGNEPKWRTFTDPDGFSWSISPGEWTLLGPRPSEEAVDLTSVRAMYRLTGVTAAQLMSRICALDLSPEEFSNGAAARTLVAGVATEIVRDDQEDTLSFLLLPSRSYGRYIEETIRDAGIEFGIS